MFAPTTPESLENAVLRAHCSLALLTRLAQAESLATRSGTSPKLDEECACAIEQLLLGVKATLKRFADERGVL